MPPNTKEDFIHTRFSWYVRVCHRCNKKYKTQRKHSEVCGKCNRGTQTDKRTYVYKDCMYCQEKTRVAENVQPQCCSKCFHCYHQWDWDEKKDEWICEVCSKKKNLKEYGFK